MHDNIHDSMHRSTKNSTLEATKDSGRGPNWLKIGATERQQSAGMAEVTAREERRSELSRGTEPRAGATEDCLETERNAEEGIRQSVKQLIDAAFIIRKQTSQPENRLADASKQVS